MQTELEVDTFLESLRKELKVREFSVNIENEYNEVPKEQMYEYVANGHTTITIKLKPEYKWKAPTWLKEGSWIAMDKDGVWYVYLAKPKQGSVAWWSIDGTTKPLNSPIEFDPPLCTDWKQSLRQIKHDE